jgi:hypothetical protein
LSYRHASLHRLAESIPGLLKNFKIPSLAGRYDNPVPTRFLVPIDCYKIPAKKLRSLLFTFSLTSERMKRESRRSSVVQFPFQGDDSLVFDCGVHCYSVHTVLPTPRRKQSPNL